VVGQWEDNAKGLPTIVFCPSISSAKNIAGQFQDRGHNFVTISGDMNREYRKKVISDLALGNIDGITSCDVVSEGTDIPVVSCAVLLRKTESTSLYLQQVGRVLRPVDGKTAIVIDFMENYLKHGLPCADREWSLDGVKKKEKDPLMCHDCMHINKNGAKVCVQCGAVLKFKECTQCLSVYSFEKTECPECGYEEPKKKRKEMKQTDSIYLAEIDIVSSRDRKKIQGDMAEFFLSKGKSKGNAFYKWKLLENLGCSPKKATEEQWQKAYELDSKLYSFDSFVSYNKRIFKEYDEWQKSAKA
jgi:superfamily II DNA or RNA helicase